MEAKQVRIGRGVIGSVAGKVKEVRRRSAEGKWERGGGSGAERMGWIDEWSEGGRHGGRERGEGREDGEGAESGRQGRDGGKQ